MSATGESRSSTGSAEDASGSLPHRVSAWVRSLRAALQQPLAPYYLLLSCATLLLAIGLLMVLSSSSPRSYATYGNSYHYVIRQVTWIALALPVAFLATRMPRKWLRLLAWPTVLVAVVLIVLTRSGLGFEVNGNRNWLRLGPMTLQPSELAKLAIIIWSADVYARKEKLLKHWKHMMMPVLPVVTMIAALVILQHDLGTALILIAIMLGMLWVVGAPARIFVLSFSVAAVAVFTLAATNPTRRARLLSFVDPFKDFQGAGWQAGHGLLGLASGGFFGRGIGGSQQKWGSNLPEAHTDFIFAVLGEELGLLGCLVVLALFLALAYSCIRLAMDTSDMFVRYAAAGVAIWLTAQMMVNIGMVLALLPVIGIPLPLISYGGSSLLPTLTALGLVIGFARTEPAAARALADRKRARRRGAAVDADAGVNASPRPRAKVGR